MTSYRAMDGASGRPGVGSSGTQPPGTATTFSGSYIPGLVFEVTAGNCWFEGFWWFVCAAGSPPTTAQKFCLWSLDDATGGGHWAGSSVVPGTTVTSGTLSTGWNFVPVAAPVQLAIGAPYVAAAGVNGNFPLTQNQFGTGQPYAAGITNGPLFAYPDGAAGSYSFVQSPFTTAGSDPAVNLPSFQDQKDILWLDVQVSDTAPAAYSGSWRLWPNMYGALGTNGDAAQTFILATEVHLSQLALLDAIWYYSPHGSASLATWCGIYDLNTQALVAAVTSPSWTKPDGVTAASAGDGPVRCAFPGNTLLQPGQYKVAYYNAGGTGGSWSPTTYGYFNGSGPGSGGITSGPLSAPPQASAASAFIYDSAGGSNTPPFSGHGTEPSQGTFAMTGPQYPYLAVDFNVEGPAGAIAETFWADMEVTPVTGSNLAGTGSVITSPEGPAGAAALTGTGTLALAETLRSGATLAAAGSLSPKAAQRAGAHLTAAGSLFAIPGSTTVDITVSVGPTVSRSQANAGNTVSRAQAAAGATQGDGTAAGAVQGDGTAAGSTTVNRSR